MGASLARKRGRQLTLWGAWWNANLANAKKLPPLDKVMRWLEPAKTMSPRVQRNQILGMAQAMGALVIRRKKGESIQ